MTIISLVMYTLIFGVGSIAFLSFRGRAADIYVIWYVNSLFFVLFYGLEVATKLQGVSLLDVCGPYKEVCNSVYDMLTNSEHEFLLIYVLLGIALVPQILTYLLSGLSGCASAPHYVSEITSIGLWSIIKFTAGLGGILVASSLAALTVRQSVSFHEFGMGFRWLPTAFFMALGHHLLVREFPQMIREERDSRVLRFLSRIHRLATWNVPPEPPIAPWSWRRRLLIEMLKSDVVYDYLTGDAQGAEARNQGTATPDTHNAP
jgi:hypothetical protein